MSKAYNPHSVIRELESIAAEIRTKHPPVIAVENDDADLRLALYGEHFDSRLPYVSYGEGGL